MSSTLETGPVRSTMADDPDFLELVEMFVDGMGEKRDTLSQASSGGDFEAIRKTAHQLKGSGGGYGFPGISERAASLEQACKEGLGPEVIADRLQTLLTYLDRVVV